MAAAITTTSTTLEGQFFEISNALQEGELAQPELARPNRINVTFDTETQTVSIAATLDTTMVRSGSNLTFAPVSYLP